ncbi:hypothetical protein ACFXPX_38585 [Kitasatospora sp. NPDC059146]|uniref:hypothetical protein n=1 Tax=unclassified Kitasatospora TaxID=2633591 RepID=UPI00368FB8E0
MTLQNSGPLEQTTLTASYRAVHDEAEIHLLVNGGGTPQTDADMAQAADVARTL